MQVNLEPSLGPSGSSTRVQSVFSAQANSIAVYQAPAQPYLGSTANLTAKYIYLAQYEASQNESRELKVASYTIWASLQVSTIPR